MTSKKLSNISLSEKLHSKQPDYVFMKTFGCEALAYNEHQNHKFDNRVVRLCFLVIHLQPRTILSMISLQRSSWLVDMSYFLKTIFLFVHDHDDVNDSLPICSSNNVEDFFNYSYKGLESPSTEGHNIPSMNFAGTKKNHNLMLTTIILSKSTIHKGIIHKTGISKMILPSPSTIHLN